jgi:hypothetical protein
LTEPQCTATAELAQKENRKTANSREVESAGVSKIAPTAANPNHANHTGVVQPLLPPVDGGGGGGGGGDGGGIMNEAGGRCDDAANMLLAFRAENKEHEGFDWLKVSEYTVHYENAKQCETKPYKPRANFDLSPSHQPSTH